LFCPAAERRQPRRLIGDAPVCLGQIAQVPAVFGVALAQNYYRMYRPPRMILGRMEGALRPTEVPDAAGVDYLPLVILTIAKTAIRCG